MQDTTSRNIEEVSSPQITLKSATELVSNLEKINSTEGITTGTGGCTNFVNSEHNDQSLKAKMNSFVNLKLGNES